MVSPKYILPGFKPISDPPVVGKQCIFQTTNWDIAEGIFIHGDLAFCNGRTPVLSWMAYKEFDIRYPYPSMNPMTKVLNSYEHTNHPFLTTEGEIEKLKDKLSQLGATTDPETLKLIWALLTKD